jgi:hypothetical protein
MRVISRPAFGLGTGSICFPTSRAPREFGATQIDLTLRRQFRLTDRFSLQTRGDLFNIFNRPNLGDSANYLYSSPSVKNPQSGQSTMTWQATWEGAARAEATIAVSIWRPAIGAAGP